MIKSIVEKPTSSPNPPQFTPPQVPTLGGFPRATHRSQSTSLFSKARSKPLPSRQAQAPVVQSTVPIPPPPTSRISFPQNLSDEQHIIDSAQRENEERIAGMSLEERQQEAKELVERFGGGLADILRKRREARERGNDAAGPSLAFVASPSPSDPTPSVEEVETPASKTVRFAPPPGSTPPHPDPKSEDTPLSIHTRYFPTDTTYDSSKLEWLQPLPSTSASSSATRYDLAGHPIPVAQLSSLPAHLGLHHHGEDPTLAGYTLDEVLHLCLSTSVAQRVAMLDVLAKIVRSSVSSSEGSDEIEGGLVEKALDVASLALMDTKGGLNISSRGIEIVYEILVGSEEQVEIREEVLGGVLARGLKNRTRQGEEKVVLMKLPGLIPLLVGQLGNAGLSQSRTVHQLLAILVRVARLPDPVGELLLSSTSSSSSASSSASSSSPLLQVISKNLQSSSPDPLNLTLLHSLILSSRATALRLMNSPSSPLPSLLRFVALSSTSPTHQILAKLSVDIYASLGKYGLLSFICSDGSDIWRQLEQAVHSDLQPLLSSSRRQPSKAQVELASSFYSLLTSWTICAIDPHQTSPEHDITWSQAQGMGWFTDSLRVLDGFLDRVREGGSDEGCLDLVRNLLGFVRAWIEGAEVNEVRGGEEVKREVGGLNGLSEKNVVLLVENLGKGVQVELDQPTVSGEKVGKMVGVLDSLLRVFRASSSSPISPTLDEPLEKTFKALLSSSLFTSNVSYLHLRPITSFLTFYLLQKRAFLPVAHWLSLTLYVLRMLVPGDESLARSLMEQVLALDMEALPGGKEVLGKVSHRHGFWILEPFYFYVVSPPEEAHVAPLFPSPTSLKRITSLRLPPSPLNGPAGLTSPSASTGSSRSKCGLPLSPTWMFSPLDELLHSTSSRAFASAPPSWDASEPELVQATLAFATLSLSLAPPPGVSLQGVRLNASQMMYECIKVFLLEKGVVAPQLEHGRTGEGQEVFRDRQVEALLRELLKPFFFWSTTYRPPLEHTRPRTLEEAHAASSTPSLSASGGGGKTTPFFQTYTDLHALYASISYAHPIFASLLLPPLAQSYDPDYRKLFWNGDNVSLFPGITTRLAHVPCEHQAESQGGIEAFLWPKETDGDQLGSYLRALVGAQPISREPNEFLYLLAVHHLSLAIFADHPSARSLVASLVAKAREEVLRDVMGYRQVEGTLVLPPLCFEAMDENEVGSRLERLKAWVGEHGLKKVRDAGFGRRLI